MSAPLRILAQTPAGYPGRAFTPAFPPATAPDATPFTPPASRRDRLWELSPNLHCSIIGTCLTTADLRSLMAKLGIAASAGVSEHDLHAQAVSRAARKEEGGKLLHKLLDRRHERDIQRLARATNADALRALWRASLERGDIPGAYWAVLTHPLTDRGLVKEAFGEVHMLSHLLGRSVRADLRRLAELEAEARVRLDTIAALEARVTDLTRARVAAERHGEDLERDLRDARAAPREEAVDPESDATVARLREQLGRVQARAAAEEERRLEAERVAHRLAEEVRDAAIREATLARELACLEDGIATPGETGAAGRASDLGGLTFLYVGGRPRQVAQARLALHARGASLITHDGGVEEATTLLPGLVSRADAVLFPVDCVSHDAVGATKKACRDLDRPWIALRTTGFASLLLALRDGLPPARPPAGSP